MNILNYIFLVFQQVYNRQHLSCVKTYSNLIGRHEDEQILDIIHLCDKSYDGNIPTVLVELIAMQRCAMWKNMMILSIRSCRLTARLDQTRPDQVRICLAIFPFTLTSCIHYMLIAVAASPSNIYIITVNSLSSAKSTFPILQLCSHVT